MGKNKSVFLFIIIISLGVFFNACSVSDNNIEQTELLFYVGATIIKPIEELSMKFEEENNCKIEIIKGGSQELYEKLETSNKGDLFLPGSNSYRLENMKFGKILDGQFVGYNKIALIVKKTNPLNFSGDLKELAYSNTRVVIGDPQVGSIGHETKQILEKYGNFLDVFTNALYLTSDSRNLIIAVKNDEADICINWYASIYSDEADGKVEAINIDEKYIKKEKLVLNLLKSSEHKDLAKKFMNYASSDEGKKIFKKYGFLNDAEIIDFDKIDIDN